MTQIGPHRVPEDEQAPARSPGRVDPSTPVQQPIELFPIGQDDGLRGRTCLGLRPGDGPRTRLVLGRGRGGTAQVLNGAIGGDRPRLLDQIGRVFRQNPDSAARAP